MKLARFLFGVNVRGVSLENLAPDCEITAVCDDSRQATDGCMFICLRGIRDDGHNHVPQAIERGAAVVVCERADTIPPGTPYILVDDTRSACAKIWNNFCGGPASKLRIVAVTGTNGKTTTASLIEKLLSAAGGTESGVRLIGTLTGTLTTPDPHDLYPMLASFVREGSGSVVMEASSHALALGKLDALVPEIAVFTNLSPEHLDFHGTMDAYFEAKAKLFRMARVGVVNADDGYFERLSAAATCPIKSYSPSGEKASYRAVNVRYHGAEGTSYILLGPGVETEIYTPLCGAFNVANTLAAAAAALELGIPPETVARAIAEFKAVLGRFERVPTPGTGFDVFIDYAHTPDALENILRAARGVMKPGGRLTVLFGCGGDRDPYKRPVMGRVASTLADFTVITSDNSRSEKPSDIIAQILKGFDRERPHKVIENRAEAIKYALSSAREGDLIILAGKGHENYEITASGKRHFDEREIVAEWLAGWQSDAGRQI
ncbi:MAG: UDP-N-acetylmuramoyl-L-alanyl-D-glutamate--2,6-diaminopimelate ligase [Eubacteriales bacterium]